MTDIAEPKTIESNDTVETYENYRDEMIDKVSQIFEETGVDDASYTLEQRVEDIFNVLEASLAFNTFAISQEAGDIRDICEESYINIKRMALNMLSELNEESEGSTIEH